MKDEPLYYGPKGRPSRMARVTAGSLNRRGAAELARLQKERNALRRVILEWFEGKRPDDYTAEQHARDWRVNCVNAGDDLLAEAASKIVLEQEV